MNKLPYYNSHSYLPNFEDVKALLIASDTPFPHVGRSMASISWKNSLFSDIGNSGDFPISEIHFPLSEVHFPISNIHFPKSENQL